MAARPARRVAQPLLLGALLAAVCAAGLHWGTFVAGGSDWYCYAHQAERWASWTLRTPDPLALAAPWPDAFMTFAPAGHVPSRVVPGAIVPICPSGLSLVMAPFLAAGGQRAIFLVVPVFGALLVAAVFVIGSRYGAAVGWASAIPTAASPAFLYQLMQPMSDVPAAALWLLAVACATSPSARGPVLAGAATSAAILMRPNLLPLGLVIGLFLAIRPGRAWPLRFRQAALYALACAPGCLAVGAIQNMFYGSPLSSGYGSLDALFSFDHVRPNLTRYAGWLWQTHTPLWLLAAAAPFLLPGWLTALLVSLIAVNLLCYLPYTVFDDWWYLRFLLPVIPLLLVLMLAVIDAAATRILSGTRRGLAVAVLAVAAALLAVSFVRVATMRSVFELARLESRFERGGEFARRRLPANALVITSWQSGSVRFYSGHPTLVWDQLDPQWLDRALAFVRDRSFEPYLLLERWEEPAFRQRFAGSGVAALDWPPLAEIGNQVRIYRPADRERYYAGAQVLTEYAK